MPCICRFEIIKKPKQPVLSVKTTTNVEKLPILIGEIYGKIEEYLTENNEFPSDVPFVRYLNMDMNNLKVEIGIPVYKELKGNDEIESSFLPEMKAVYSMFRGPYNQLEPFYNEMIEFINENKLTPDMTTIEYYYNDPEDVDESELITSVLMPIN